MRELHLPSLVLVPEHLALGVTAAAPARHQVFLRERGAWGIKCFGNQEGLEQREECNDFLNARLLGKQAKFFLIVRMK